MGALMRSIKRVGNAVEYRQLNASEVATRAKYMSAQSTEARLQVDVDKYGVNGTEAERMQFLLAVSMWNMIHPTDTPAQATRGVRALNEMHLRAIRG